ncbi:MFS transporter [Actinocatenispora thailandica]|uniref:MFS transporter n=1 Tax=Actinocatenispora thailandica TaxID=227318 RepID=A0A7R7DV15_9ACTN|nr:MFS transporter [Actinocatenispora thailandica]BCJ38365.1 MFS transporter [Actinocatenispora thailandica]
MTQTLTAERATVRTPGLGAAGLGASTLAAAVATATSYVLQPELSDVAAGIGTSLSTVGMLAGVPIAGYLVGLVLLVPLADRWRSNRLIAGQLALLGAGLAVAAAAPNPVLLGFGLLVAGACASTGAQLSSLAGRYSGGARRGRTVGTVTAGISAGIVLGRILGGVLADRFGWRLMLAGFAAACVLLGLAALRTLPNRQLSPTQGYRTVLVALPRLVWADRSLRFAALSGALWFFAFSLVWVGLSLALARPPVSLPPGTIGLYALAGLLGMVVTRFAGRLADRFGWSRVVCCGLLVAAGCTALLGASLAHPVPLLLALALFDAGLFAAQVANQSRVLGLDPSRPAQLNSAYMTVYFVGGTAGTTVGGLVLSAAGWPSVAALAALALVLALALFRAGLRGR